MDVRKREDIVHRNPTERKDYPYAFNHVLFETPQLFLSSEKVRPGARASAPHFHSQRDEIIYVLKNELYAVEGDQEVHLLEGDSLCFKAGCEKKHYLENRSQEDSEFLVFRATRALKDTRF